MRYLRSLSRSLARSRGLALSLYTTYTYIYAYIHQGRRRQGSERFFAKSSVCVCACGHICVYVCGCTSVCAHIYKKQAHTYIYKTKDGEGKALGAFLASFEVEFTRHCGDMSPQP
eukprot:Tamp_25166.p3 GENE.Tamp_25166~~Tamp_25166.p3  ORF type:complete len:115 (+),score=6.26 Tamp_25166:232-576(+)